MGKGKASLANKKYVTSAPRRTRRRQVMTLKKTWILIWVPMGDCVVLSNLLTLYKPSMRRRFSTPIYLILEGQIQKGKKGMKRNLHI